MKISAAATLALALNLNLAHAATPCDVWEYARLKDSTKVELTEHACASSQAAAANQDEKWKILRNVGGNSLKEAERVGQAEAVCRDQVKVTKFVFLQKFGKALSNEDCAAPANYDK